MRVAYAGIRQLDIRYPKGVDSSGEPQDVKDAYRRHCDKLASLDPFLKAYLDLCGKIDLASTSIHDWKRGAGEIPHRFEHLVEGHEESRHGKKKEHNRPIDLRKLKGQFNSGEAPFMMSSAFDDNEDESSNFVSMTGDFCQCGPHAIPVPIHTGSDFCQCGPHAIPVPIATGVYGPSVEVVKDAVNGVPKRALNGVRKGRKNKKNNKSNNRSNPKAVQHIIAPTPAGPVIHIHNGPGPRNQHSQGWGTHPSQLHNHPHVQGGGGGFPRGAYNMNAKGRRDQMGRAPMEDPEASAYQLGSSMAQPSRYVF
jgi:hypothetical protein